MSEDLLTIAQHLTAAGISVIPIRPDGSKAPAISEWGPYQNRIAAGAEISAWFGNGHVSGIAAIGGEVSGGLEVIDFDQPELFREWADLLKEQGAIDLLKLLVIVQTPSGGWHVYYRCQEVKGNKKLAQKSDSTPQNPHGRKTLIETRGRGGYVLLPGSPAECHASGKIYELKRGNLSLIPTITAEERKLLLDTARVFNETPVKPAETITGGSDHKGDRPGDDFNRRTGWDEILEPSGAKRIYTRGGVDFWCRPGKKVGVSATTNHGGSDLLFVFSSNWGPFEPETSYTKFAAFALLNHGGDFKAAARDLAKQGFGTPEPPSQVAPEQPSEPQPDRQPVEEKKNKFNRTDSGNARLFSSMFAGQVKYDHGRQRWLLYREHRWQEDSDGEIVRLMQETARRRYQLAAEIQDLDERKREAAFAISSETRGKIDSALALAQAERELADSGSNWNKDPLLLCAGNGVILLNTGTLRQGLPSDAITLRTAVPYDPSAECPRWLSFLTEIFRDNPELPDFIRRAVGYSMTGDTSEQVLFLCYGTGSNGKSVFLGIIREVLGEYAYNMPFSTIELHDRSAIPNDLAALVDRRFVTAAETNATARLNEARIKALTGGDPITARFLHCEFFTYRPVAKFWLSVNHKPRVSDDSYGFWRRVRLIPFTREFRGAEADPRLEEKLRAELPGILAWAVRGSLEWKKSGLNPPECVTAATEQYRVESDPLAEFIEERCLQMQNYSVSAGELYKSYAKWTEERGMKDSEKLTMTAFGSRMAQRFEKTRGARGIIYIGIGLKV
jgi:putative DNA primase/helicase